jgi:hypothetical protein
MNAQAHAEDVKTDLPSPKPNRRKRLALRFAALVVAVSALGAAYWFTRPPELVWWRSPEIGNSGRHVRLLIPNGWESELPLSKGEDFMEQWEAIYYFSPVDRRPKLLRHIFAREGEYTAMVVKVIQSHSKLIGREGPASAVAFGESSAKFGSERVATFIDARIGAGVYYGRDNRLEFNSTQATICNSLRIE